MNVDHVFGCLRHLDRVNEAIALNRRVLVALAGSKNVRLSNFLLILLQLFGVQNESLTLWI
jgi:hypothetical protein